MATLAGVFDVAVVGLGPAGRALASACAGRGLGVLAIDPVPHAVWTPTYGLWADELGALPPAVVRSRMGHPEIRAHGVHDLDRTYVVLDNAATQAALPLTGVEVETGRLDDAGLAGLRRRARVVVDARGARPAGRVPGDAAPAQTAAGLVLDAADAAPALAGAEALLMDFTPDWAEDPSRPDGPASFLYALPLGGGRVLVEETCLAAAPGLGIDVLSQRLHRRLTRRGVDAAALAAPLGREIVRIPLHGRGARPVAGTLAVGTAGRGGHPVTGYSVAHSLAQAAPLAAAIAAGHLREPDPVRPADLARALALRALLRLDAPATIALFEAFGRLPRPRQRAFLNRDAAPGAVLGAMWTMFRHLSPGDGLRLARATFGPG